MIDEASGLPYYYHTKTGDTICEKPQAFVIPLTVLQGSVIVLLCVPNLNKYRILALLGDCHSPGLTQPHLKLEAVIIRISLATDARVHTMKTMTRSVQALHRRSPLSRAHAAVHSPLPSPTRRLRLRNRIRTLRSPGP